MYLWMPISIAGKEAPDGTSITTDEQIRRFLLEHAGIAVSAISAFGLRHDSGWFRASVGAVSKVDCEGIGQRLGAALAKLR